MQTFAFALVNCLISTCKSLSIYFLPLVQLGKGVIKLWNTTLGTHPHHDDAQSHHQPQTSQCPKFTRLPQQTAPSPIPRAPLTCHGCSKAVILAALLTHPLLAALVVELHPPGVGALVIRAERDAADGPIHADALQFACGLEALPVEVHLAQQVTCCTLMSWGRKKRRRSKQKVKALPWGHRTPEEGQTPSSSALPSQS